MRLLAIDPSRSCTGYAVFAGDAAEPRLIECGRLVPSLARRHLAGLPLQLRDHLAQRPLTALRAIHSIVADVEELIESHGPDQIVVEIPSGLIGTGAKQGARGALTTYGLAAGVIYEACRRLRPGSVVPVTERMWTAAPAMRGRGRGRHPGGVKQGRRVAASALYPRAYDPGQDPGGDAADAILLGQWWLDRSRQATSSAVVGPPRGG